MGDQATTTINQLARPETPLANAFWAYDAGGCIIPLGFRIVAAQSEASKNFWACAWAELDVHVHVHVHLLGQASLHPNLAGLGSQKSNQRPLPTLQTPLATAATHIIRDHWVVACPR